MRRNRDWPGIPGGMGPEALDVVHQNSTTYAEVAAGHHTRRLVASDGQRFCEITSNFP